MFGRGKKEPPVKIVVVVVPVVGKSTTKKATVDGSMSVKEALTEAGISAEGMQISLGGKPVTDLDQPISFSAKIELTPKFVATERPSGS